MQDKTEGVALRRRGRALGRRLCRIALERPIDVERALDADRVEIRLEPFLGVIASEVVQLLEERPGYVVLGRGAEGFELARPANAMEPFLPVFVAFEHAGTDEAGDEVGGPKLRQKARVEGDL